MKSFNTFIERTFTLFPLFVVLLTITGLIVSLKKSSLTYALIGSLLSLSMLFLIPLIAFRIFNLFYPLIEGKHLIISPRGICPWTVSFHIQRILIAIPQLEFFLMAIPGVYSLWLRLWGSKIGKRVQWMNTVVLDRSGLDIGDNVFFGYSCYISSHVAMPMNNKFILYFKKVTVGNNTFVGATSVLAPGVKIAGNNIIQAQTITKINSSI